MNDGMSDPTGVSTSDGRKNTRTAVRRAARELRDGTADSYGGLVVTPPAGMQDNARLFDAADERAAAHEFDARLRPLTRRQLAAISLLTMGKSVVAAARSLQVDPSTIHRWKATSPQFAAELNRRQAALFDGMVIKLRLAMQLAVNELSATMRSQSRRDRGEVMWKLLPMMRPARLIVPNGATTAAGVLDERVRAARAGRGEVVEMEITDDERLALVPAADLAEADAEPEDVAEATNDPAVSPDVATPSEASPT